MGRWTISITREGCTRVSYFDFTTRKSWRCGEVPADVSSRATLEWVVGQCRYNDLIVDNGNVFLVTQPVIECADLGDHDDVVRA